MCWFVGVAFTAKVTSFSYVTRADDKADTFSDLSDSEHVEYRKESPCFHVKLGDNNID